MDKVAETSALAELSALYEIASLAPSDSEEGFAREAMEKAARLSGVRRFALFKGPVRHGHLLASWGFKSAREIPRRLEQNEPNQIRFDFGADGELGTLVMEQPGPI
ncbi:MAG: hypothetical protein KAU10_07315, partial [Dehalococcoidia bacterium]|nr:hypothetical protein [Dehalococcoidia bacterium]